MSNERNTLSQCQSELVLANTGERALPKSGWALYFNFYQAIGSSPQTSAVHITHLNGDFYRLEPGSSFLPLKPGEKLAIPLYFPFPIINKSLAPSGFYFVFADSAGQASQAVPIADVAVDPFVGPSQTSRGKSDIRPLQSPEVRFAENQTADLLPLDQVGKVLPTPAHAEYSDGVTMITARTTIVHSPELRSEADYLASVIQPLLGVRLRVSTRDISASAIYLTLNKAALDNRRPHDGMESYTLKVAPRGAITISGSDAAGVFYGIETLRALIPTNYYHSRHAAIPVEGTTIEDAPRFLYRGLTLDVARNFQSKRTILKLLDGMAFYKLNKLQLHLADDEGWRLAIDGLPELTQVGGRRGHTLRETDRLVPSFGSGPSTNPAISHGSGYYSRADLVDILRYAKLRHIEVIPEIESPGHARAAVKAMQARFLRLMKEGRTEDAKAYLLSDPEDQSSYQSVQGWHDNVMNVCMPSTLHFMQKVFDELGAIYAQSEAPLTAVHVGGDEVPRGAWTQSPACGVMTGTTSDSQAADHLRSGFMQQINALLKHKGVTTATWEEGLIQTTPAGDVAPDPVLLDGHMLAYAWNNVWGGESRGTAYMLANAGYDVVMAQASNLYFDMPYNKDPEEPGNYWAGFVDTKQAYEFTPSNFYAAARSDSMGKSIHPCTAFNGRERLGESGKHHIVGIQGSLWGEHVLGRSVMEYFLFPRLLALSERAWAQQPAWESDCDGLNSAVFAHGWNEFANQLGQRELPRLSYIDGGFLYRVPLPGAVIERGILKANVSFPGLALRYTTDGSEPTASSTKYLAPVPVAGRVRIRTFDSRGRGSRTSTISPNSF